MGSLVQSDPLVLAVAAAVCILGVARFTRLWIYDAWPPVVWARERFLAWSERVEDGELTWRYGWQPLAKCPWCVAPWFALVSLAWAWASGLSSIHGWGMAWWSLHIWFTVSYLAPMVVVRDEPPSDAE